MCGIAGIYSTKLEREQKAVLINKMLTYLAHRGPDGRDMYVDDLVALGMTRLAIVDRSNNKVLIWNESEQIVIAHNGEIYNSQQLRDTLHKHKFSTKTDTEVLLHLIEEQGGDSLEKVSGDYSFVIWDRHASQGMIARDPVGVKPLYIADIPGGIAFSSELNALLLCFPHLKDVDPLSIYDYLYHRFVPGPKTIFRGIRKLPPGAKLFFGVNSSCSIVEAKDHPHITNLGEADLVNVGRFALSQAVADRIPKEVPFGILLSGGLDSSLITSIVAQTQKEPIHTFSVVYTTDQGDLEYSEHLVSHFIAKHFSSIHKEIPIGARMFSDAGKDSIKHLGEPVADPTAVLLGILCKVAKESVTVLLSGEGADEIFAGYSIYQKMLSSGQSYTGMGRLVIKEVQKKILEDSIWPMIENYQTAPALFAHGLAINNLLDPLDQMLEVDRSFWLPDDLLAKADRMGMMSSIEIRVPYLDDRVISFSRIVPSYLKLNSSQGNKIILRMIAEGYLPSSIIRQPKRGFPLPLGRWLKGPLRNWTTEMLESLSKRHYFNTKGLNDLSQHYFKDPPSNWNDHIIWALITLELFFQTEIDES